MVLFHVVFYHDRYRQVCGGQGPQNAGDRRGQQRRWQQRCRCVWARSGARGARSPGVLLDADLLGFGEGKDDEEAEQQQQEPRVGVPVIGHLGGARHRHVQGVTHWGNRGSHQSQVTQPNQDTSSSDKPELWKKHRHLRDPVFMKLCLSTGILLMTRLKFSQTFFEKRGQPVPRPNEGYELFYQAWDLNLWPSDYRVSVMW